MFFLENLSLMLVLSISKSTISSLSTMISPQEVKINIMSPFKSCLPFWFESRKNISVKKCNIFWTSKMSTTQKHPCAIFFAEHTSTNTWNSNAMWWGINFLCFYLSNPNCQAEKKWKNYAWLRNFLCSLKWRLQDC